MFHHALGPLIFSVIFAWAALVAPVNSKAMTEAVSPQVYAHRGMRAFLPENVLPSYTSALRLGTDWIDMDVVLTKDGEILVTHDPVLNPDIVRDANGKYLAPNREALRAMKSADRTAYENRYAVKNLMLAETRAFDVGRINVTSAYARFFPEQMAVDGTHMPTLTEVIRHVKAMTKPVSSGDPKLGPKIISKSVGFQIEMKTDPTQPLISADPKLFAAALDGVLRAENIVESAEIQAFDFSCLRELQKLNPLVHTAYLTSRENEKGGEGDFYAGDLHKATAWTGGESVKKFDGSIPKMVKALGGYAWEPEDYELTKESLAEAHSLGLKVVVWSWPEKLGTAFDPKLTERMIDWRVDGIITDDPGRLSSMLAARGLRVPARH